MVRTIRGDRVALDVADDGVTTMAQVKSMVIAREHVPLAMQRLFFAGCNLDDDHRTLVHYGVQHDSVLFHGLHLRSDAAMPCQKETMHSLQMPSESMAAKLEMQQKVHVHDHGHEDDAARDCFGGEKIEKANSRKPVSRRLLRKILSKMHVDAWARQRDAKFLDLLLRHKAGHDGVGGACGVGELNDEDWSAVHDELNAATGSAFPVKKLQRRLGEFRRELEATVWIKSHIRFRYDQRRRAIVVGEADWKRYTLLTTASIV